jgi:hypothetical protein
MIPPNETDTAARDDVSGATPLGDILIGDIYNCRISDIKTDISGRLCRICIDFESIYLNIPARAVAQIHDAVASIGHPVIVCELTKAPWTQTNFRRWWRIIAREAGVPDANPEPRQPRRRGHRDGRGGRLANALWATATRRRPRATSGTE